MMNIRMRLSSTGTFIGVLLVAAMVVGLTACADEQEDLDGVEMDTAAVDTARAMPAEPMTAGGDTVEVEMTEFQIDMPATLPAGSTIFKVTNSGTVEHNLEIEGQGIEREFPQNLQPGDSNTMEVDLQEGSYVVYCPVADHQGRGMELDLTVEGGMAR